MVIVFGVIVLLSVMMFLVAHFIKPLKHNKQQGNKPFDNNKLNPNEKPKTKSEILKNQPLYHDIPQAHFKNSEFA